METFTISLVAPTDFHISAFRHVSLESQVLRVTAASHLLHVRSLRFLSASVKIAVFAEHESSRAATQPFAGLSLTPSEARLQKASRSTARHAIQRDIVKVSIRCKNLPVLPSCLNALEQANRHVT
jgi:hypothetical protein